MSITKRKIADRDIWFSVERPFVPDPDTGELKESQGHYVSFSTTEPGIIQGELLKDDRGQVKLFRSEEEALKAGEKEVQSRLGLPAAAFAVGLPGGTKQTEFDAYVKLLQEDGIDATNKRRVEDSFGRKWLHVWDVRQAAEDFAARLRLKTRNRDWEVYELKPMSARSEDRGPLEILLGRQGDGNSYSLDPKSFKAIRQKFARVSVQPSVYIGLDTQSNYEDSRGPVYDQVATLLTGLSTKQISETFGGYRVIDPVSNLTLWQGKDAN